MTGGDSHGSEGTVATAGSPLPPEPSVLQARAEPSIGRTDAEGVGTGGPARATAKSRRGRVSFGGDNVRLIPSNNVTGMQQLAIATPSSSSSDTYPNTAIASSPLTTTSKATLHSARPTLTARPSQSIRAPPVPSTTSCDLAGSSDGYVRVKKRDYDTFLAFRASQNQSPTLPLPSSPEGSSTPTQTAPDDVVVASLQAQIIELRRKKEKYKSQMKHCKARADQYKASAETYAAAADQLASQVEKGNASYQVTMDVRLAQIKDKKRELAEAHADLKELREEVAGVRMVKDELERCKRRCKELEGQVEAWKARHAGGT